MRRYEVLCLSIAVFAFGCAAAVHASEDAMTHYLEGLQSAEEGNLDEGIAHLRAASALDTMAAEIPRELARLLIDSQKPTEAIDPIRRALRLAPDDPEAHWLLGNALLRTGHPEEAIPPFQEARRLDPANRNYVVSLLLALESEGRNEEALDLLTPGPHGMAPDSPYLLMRRGILRSRLGQSLQALGDFVRVAKSSPGYPGAIDHLLALCWRLGPSDSTAAACAGALEAEPGRSDLRRELARILLTLDRQDEAVAHLERLLVDQPKDATIPMQLGVVYFGKERLPEAIGLFQRARSLDPSLSDSGDWLWRALNRADSLQAALRLAEDLASHAPEEPKFYWYKAISLARLSRPGEALKALDQVHRLAPNDRDARLLAAALLEETGKPAEARTHLERVLESRPDDREVLFRLGVLEEKEGRLEASLAWFRRLLAAHPDDAQALNYAGYLCADRGIELELAVEWTSRAVSLEEGNAAYQDSFGWALYRLGRFDEAVKHLKRAVEIDPREPEIQIHLAKGYRAAGRSEEGRRILQQLIHSQPADRRSRELLQLWNQAGADSGNRR